MTSYAITEHEDPGHFLKILMVHTDSIYFGLFFINITLLITF